jgi:hypothetical protein
MNQKVDQLQKQGAQLVHSASYGSSGRKWTCFKRLTCGEARQPASEQRHSNNVLSWYIRYQPQLDRTPVLSHGHCSPASCESRSAETYKPRGRHGGLHDGR